MALAKKSLRFCSLGSLSLKGVVISTNCFWSKGKILFLAEIIAGRGLRSPHMCKIKFCLIESKSLLLHFLSNHPKSFGMCCKDHLKEIVRPEYSFLKSWTLFFEVQDFQNQIQNFVRPISKFWPKILF